MNPYNRLPVLVERDLILYESNIITSTRRSVSDPQLMRARPGDARAREADALSTWKSSCSRRSKV